MAFMLATAIFIHIIFFNITSNKSDDPTAQPLIPQEIPPPYLSTIETPMEEQPSVDEVSTIHSIESASYIRSDPMDGCAGDTTIIKQLLSEIRYNKHQLPSPSGVTVNVDFWVQDISSITEITSDFELDIYINEIWLDPGLAYEHLHPCKQNISFGGEIFSKIWIPNSCFINSKQATIHDSPFRNVFLMISQNGTVWANYRVKVKGPCTFDLSHFPMDVQKCILIYESFSYNRDEVNLKWADMPNPIWSVKNFSLPDFVLTGMHNSSETVIYPGGVWNELYATFAFKRRFVWYMLQAYIPSYLIIFISWISFTLGLRATPARTMLGVNSLLAMVILFGNIMRNLPRVSYVTAFDVWMLGCITFIFCSLLELAIVELMAKETAIRSVRRKRSRGDHYVSVGVSAGQQREPSESYAMFYQKCLSCDIHDWTADRMDKASCLAFPALFALFNILYWGYYAQP